MNALIKWKFWVWNPPRLKQHVLSNHENRRYRCEYPDCEKSYTTKECLKDHIASCHENRINHETHKNKKHQCPADIDSQIKTVAALISGFESFECTDCFLNKWFFNVHFLFCIEIFRLQRVFYKDFFLTIVFFYSIPKWKSVCWPRGLDRASFLQK